ncbi:hypothetical protein HBH56_093610 [Parastagonospora nodorum]|uniref:Uncharacterized protein n=1 Tax=Phaeosphaeria nodorum (strain SN15 / ATCC MYA-4574 / FGSC 10173) TaxID=321614 RepID=A0A7U2ID80_PHANO|nr:hypothetical protein HBH56_093610 [Parastagonospora nodorum]QRD07660.1 hypothetical protein JI435_424710 [Parastagonospora nodorum SN15]KAH3921635.1 hypothetical protein HBH54_237780 [Parastagonospora nodorum]KAH3939727.1 hypothetical protein HBH53_229720 [Parastagonospora nodorum]KAH3967440.1 hypothetical protein HBH52_187480 [Parastagonospora nodorum]
MRTITLPPRAVIHTSQPTYFHCLLLMVEGSRWIWEGYRLDVYFAHLHWRLPISQSGIVRQGIGLSHHIDARRTDVWSDWRSSQHSSLGCWTSRTHLLNTPIPQAPRSCRLNLAGPLIAPVLVIKVGQVGRGLHSLYRSFIKRMEMVKQKWNQIHSLVPWRQRR